MHGTALNTSVSARVGLTSPRARLVLSPSPKRSDDENVGPGVITSNDILDSLGISSQDARAKKGWDARVECDKGPFARAYHQIAIVVCEKGRGTYARLSCPSDEASECVRCLNMILPDVEER